MPGLVADPQVVVSGVTEAESEAGSMLAEPAKGRCIFEFFFQRRAIQRTDIYCPASVMLTESGCRIHPQNPGQVLP